MAWVAHLRAFPLFEFYLALFFLVSIFLRLQQYREVFGLAVSSPSRWPRVTQLVKQHAHILMSWETFRPLLLSGALLLIQLIVRWYIFPGAILTLGDLVALWPLLPVVALAFATMVAFDVYATWSVGTIDRPAIEKQLDQAEYWLRSWVAPVVRWLSLGFVNPRSMVQKEVAAALEAVSELMNSSLYVVAIQAGLRMLFGLTLWATYLLEPTVLAWLTSA